MPVITLPPNRSVEELDYILDALAPAVAPDPRGARVTKRLHLVIRADAYRRSRQDRPYLGAELLSGG